MRAVLVLAVTLAAPQMAALAHHSFAAEYDGDKPVTISGTVAKIDWLNPHIYFYVDVKDDKGASPSGRSKAIRRTCSCVRAGRRTSR